MKNTFETFNERKEEIEFYFTIMQKFDNGISDIDTMKNRQFYKIMKSNFLLMLYNLVESCIVSGMLEIYENLKNDSCSYNQVIYEIQEIWRKNQIDKIYKPSLEKSVYDNKVKEIIHEVITNAPIILSKDALGIGGNLNARKIKELCDNHKIRYHLQTSGASLEKIKTMRNKLAHGDESFSMCSRDMTIHELEDYKDDVFQFLKDILDGMKKYYDHKLYKENAPT